MSLNTETELITNNEAFRVRGVVELYPEKESQNEVVIDRIFVSPHEAVMGNLMNMRSGFGSLLNVTSGHYVRLKINNQIMMTDTPMERRTNRDFVVNANGKVLIAGLGVGMIIKNIIDNPEVTGVVVIENNQNVIDLVLPKINHEKLTVLHADIFNWTTTDIFDTIYFDIWPDIAVDNLDEMKTLNRRYKKNLNKENKNAWMSSWMINELKRLKRRDKRNYGF